MSVLRFVVSSSLVAITLCSCAPEDSVSQISDIETRLRAQEETSRRLDRDLGRQLSVVAERLERLADTLTATGAKTAQATVVDPVRRSVASPEPAGKEATLHAPVSPALELETQRRSAIWLAAVVGAVVAFAAAMRLRSRSLVSAIEEDEQLHDLDEADAGSWDEASVLTEAVPERRDASERFVKTEPDLHAAHPESRERPHGVMSAGAGLAVARADAASPPSSESSPSPTRCAYRIDAIHPEAARPAVESYLGHDPRVLRKPEPVVRVRDGGLTVECSMLPGLPAGEREHLRAVLERLASDR